MSDSAALQMSSEAGVSVVTEQQNAQVAELQAQACTTQAE